MKSGGSGEQDAINDINVTPLVDVSLVLVIIFMVTAPFMTQSKLSVTLPKAATDEAKNEEYVTITIDKDGKTSINETEVFNPAQMQSVIAKKLQSTDDKVIIIKADEGVDHGTVLDVMDVAKKTQPKKVYYATKMDKKGL
jgi:biopolymer transport protein ExbD